MKHGYRRDFPLKLAVALAALIADAGGVCAQPTHCRNDEATLFSCQAKGKTLSICGAGDRVVTYRFGPIGAVELNLSSQAGDKSVAVSAGSLTYSGGGGAYVAFANPPYRYVVYTAIVRDEGDTAGVAIERNGRKMGALNCSGPRTSELGPDMFERWGLARDADGFNLP